MDNSEIEKLLTAKGVRPTSNRILVLRELLRASNPLSLADLEELLGYSLDKASIFRVLELFAEKDVAHVIEGGSRSLKYEPCLTTGHHSMEDQHVHFHCEKCRKTYCLDNVKVPKVEMPEGFKSHSISYMIKGICPECG